MSQETLYYTGEVMENGGKKFYKNRKRGEFMKTKKEVLMKLFFSTLYLSAFTFGGGYVIVTLMKKKFVDEYHWIEENEMLDLVAIAQSSPGAIAVNGAIVVGYKLAGMAGAVTAIIATIIPPFVIISLISELLSKIEERVVPFIHSSTNLPTSLKKMMSAPESVP